MLLLPVQRVHYVVWQDTQFYLNTWKIPLFALQSWPCQCLRALSHILV